MPDTCSCDEARPNRRAAHHTNDRARTLDEPECRMSVSGEELFVDGALWYRDHCLELRRSNSVFVWALGDWTLIGVGCGDVTTDVLARRQRTAWGAEFPVPLAPMFTTQAWIPAALVIGARLPGIRACAWMYR